MNIQIPTPCHEPPGNMKPVKGGYFCDSCAHTVTDFRSMSEEEIKDYFKNKKGKTCGIFHPEQIHNEEPAIITGNINFFNLSAAQKFLCALLLCFNTGLFTGCSTTGTPKEVVGELEEPRYEMGAVAPLKDDTVCTNTGENFIQGQARVDTSAKDIRNDDSRTLRGNVKIDTSTYKSR